MISQSSLRITLPILILLLFLAGPASAGDDRMRLLAEKSDGEIRELLAAQLAVAQAQMEKFDSDVGLVYTSRIYKTEDWKTWLVEDQVWWVRRGEAENLTNFVEDYRPGVKVEDVRAFSIRPGETGVDAVLSAGIDRLPEERIRVTRGDDKKRSTNLVVGFETAAPGDLIGISVMTRWDRPPSWEPWLVAANEPVALAELRLMCDRRRAYAVFGSRFANGMMEQEILEQKNGQIVDLRLTAREVPPYIREPYAPPLVVQSPQFTLSWRATHYLIQGHWVWVYNEHWNMIALRMSRYEEAFLEKREKTEALAGEITEGMTPRETATALYTYVREDLQSVDSDAYYKDGEVPSVDKILEARSGSTFEKAYVLLAMMRSRGLDCEIVWTHDPENGAFFDDYPSWNQVSEPLMKVRFEQGEEWFDLTCETCRPGVIRRELRGAKGMTYTMESIDSADRLWDRSVAEAQGRQVDFYRVYMDNLKKKTWHRMITTPGRAGRYDGWCEEILTLDGDGREIELMSLGRTELGDKVEDEGDAAEAAERWVLDRFTEADGVAALEASPEGADTLRVVLGFEDDPPAPPMGDTWILEPKTLFGEPTLDPWPVERKTHFHVPLTTVRKWETRVALPAGWAGVELPKNRIVQNGPLAYQMKFSLQDGRFVVTRILVEKTATVVTSSKVAKIGQDIDAIIALESSPIVLRRKAAGS